MASARKSQIYYCQDCGIEIRKSTPRSRPVYCPTCIKRREEESYARSRAAKRSSVHMMRGAEPEQTFADIHAIQRARKAETGMFCSYGKAAAEPLLAQQAREMAERRAKIYAELGGAK